jgi:MFS superfamily sulfate permease-like transporter
MVQLFDLSLLPRLAEWPFVEFTLTIAFLASTETLLSASAVDQIHRGSRTWYDRELAAQRVGKVCAAVSAFAPDRRYHPQCRQRRRGVLLEGAAAFIRLPKLATAIETVPHSTELYVHFERLRFMDDACLERLRNWKKQHESLGGRLVIDGDSLAEKVCAPPRKDSPNAGRQRPRSQRVTVTG